MKYHYVLVLTDLVDKENRFEFVCTKTQMDKVFYPLAFACCNSTVKRGSLYRVVKDTRNVKLACHEILENTFSCSGGFKCV